MSEDFENTNVKKRRGWELQIPLIAVDGRDDSIFYVVPEIPIDLTLNLKDWAFIVLSDPAPGQFPKIVLRPRVSRSE
jgi:hypothetical protein